MSDHARSELDLAAEVVSLRSDRDSWMKLKSEADRTITQLRHEIRALQREKNRAESKNYPGELLFGIKQELAQAIRERDEWRGLAAKEAEAKNKKTEELKDLRETQEVLLRRLESEIQRGERARVLCKELARKLIIKGRKGARGAREP